jgi:hypothetical protein
MLRTCGISAKRGVRNWRAEHRTSPITKPASPVFAPVSFITADLENDPACTSWSKNHSSLQVPMKIQRPNGNSGLLNDGSNWQSAASSRVLINWKVAIFSDAIWHCMFQLHLHNSQRWNNMCTVVLNIRTETYLHEFIPVDGYAEKAEPNMLATPSPKSCSIGNPPPQCS